MGQGTPADLAAAWATAEAQGNEQAKVVYGKRLAALGLNEKGEPLKDATPAEQAGQADQPTIVQPEGEAAAPAAEARKADAAGDETTPPKGRAAPRSRQHRA